MDDETKLWSLLVFVVLCVAFLMFAGCHDSEVTNREAIKAGLVQKPNSGGTGYTWQKP